jgi:hypothetical protein
MEKNYKMLLGVAVLGVGGYLLWKSKQPKKTASFMNKKGMSGKRGLNGVKGLGGANGKRKGMVGMTGMVGNRKGMVGANGKRKGMVGANGVGNRKRMVGMINSSTVKEGPFGKKNLINSTNVQEGSFKKNLINSTKVQDGSFKTFTPENLGSDLLSVKNSNFFDQNILASKFS